MHAPTIDQLRQRHYNATVASMTRVHDDLLILRVAPDWGVLDFEAGQYTVLGLGYWEPRIDGCMPESLDSQQREHLARRAFSVTSPLVDGAGKLIRATGRNELEFFAVLVRRAESAPALSPRLFMLRPGDRLFVSPHAHGRFTLRGVGPRDNVVFAATGTGEAPHNAMLAELLARRHEGRICSTVCVRYAKDLAYLAPHRILESRFPHYRYLPLTTREPKNLDPSRADYVGKRYLQSYFESGDFERDSGIPLDPANTHVFLCGSPEMVGIRARASQPGAAKGASGMVPLLQQRGLRVDTAHQPGNIHFEQYW